MSNIQLAIIDTRLIEVARKGKRKPLTPILSDDIKL
jgi:hypothetical protein